MFKEISTELLSILSEDPIEKIAHLPTKDIAKTLELLFDIRFENVERVYNENIGNSVRHTVIYKSDKNEIKNNTCMINGKPHHFICISTNTLDKNEHNAIEICNCIVLYTILRTAIIKNDYDFIINNTSIAEKTRVMSIPVITCDTMRKLYGGAALPTIIYNCLIEKLPAFKKQLSVKGVESILNLLEEDLSIEILLDNSFICAISNNDENYPGIWGEIKNDNDDDKGSEV